LVTLSSASPERGDFLVLKEQRQKEQGQIKEYFHYPLSGEAEERVV
jgi:hypothetical protein